MRVRLVLVFALVSLSFVSLAQAQPTEPSQQFNANPQDVIDQVGDLVQGLPTDQLPTPPVQGPDLGAAFGAVGDFFSQVAGAIGQSITVTVSFVADTAVAASRGIASGVMAASDGAVAASQAIGFALTVALSASGQAIASTSVSVADATVVVVRTLGDVSVAVGRVVGDAGGFVGAQFAILGGLYASLVGSLRPEQMPEPAFVAVVATGAAGTTAAAGVGLWELVRRFGFLAGLPAVGGFSRIEDDEILKHPLRAQVFNTIQANPGIHASELARRLNVGWGTIVHHLDRLEKGDLVAIRKVNNQKCFFEMGGKVSRVDMAIAGAVRGDSASQIAAFVQSHPMTSQKAMAESLQISPALASFHVKKLVHLGVLEKARRGKETLLSTTESLRRVLAGESGAVPTPPLLVAPMVRA